MKSIEAASVRSVDDLVATVTNELAAVLSHAVHARGRAVLCLAGGSTPVPVYRRLAERRDLPWQRIWVAWGDERNVAPDHDDRNEHHARLSLLDRVAVPEDQVLAWPWVEDADPSEVAEAYALRLRRVLGDPASHVWFDVTLLGLGADAHTASLFPGSGAVHAPGLATTVQRDADGYARLTLTPRALSSSRHVWFLVSGEDKRSALEKTLGGGSADVLPATSVRATDDLRIFTDLGEVAAGD